jgi:hypothetical protein
MFEETDSVLNIISQFPQIFLTNSKLRIYVCKIPTVITETLIVKPGYTHGSCAVK